MFKGNDFQMLEDMATAGWYSQLLFKAVEQDIFSYISDGKSITYVADYYGYNHDALYRYLLALESMDLVAVDGEMVTNTSISATYLIKGKPNYQGHSIMWRKGLNDSWASLDEVLSHGGRVTFPVDDDSEAIDRRFRQYSLAMNDIAKCKAEQIMEIFSDYQINGSILDLGSGMGNISTAFLMKNSHATAVLADMENVLKLASEEISPKLQQRIKFCSMNILDKWQDLAGKQFQVIVMSNFIHVFDKSNTTAILRQAKEHLAVDGIIIIHDFFRDYYKEKAAIMDMNMMVNTYNGHVFSCDEVKSMMADAGLCYDKFIPLPSDTAIIIGK